MDKQCSMAKVIRLFDQLSQTNQEDLLNQYLDRELPRVTFPYKERLVEGIIYHSDEHTYLVPIFSMKRDNDSTYNELEQDQIEFDEENNEDQFADDDWNEVEENNDLENEE